MGYEFYTYKHDGIKLYWRLPCNYSKCISGSTVLQQLGDIISLVQYMSLYAYVKIDGNRENSRIMRSVFQIDAIYKSNNIVNACSSSVVAKMM